MWVRSPERPMRNDGSRPLAVSGEWLLRMASEAVTEDHRSHDGHFPSAREVGHSCSSTLFCSDQRSVHCFASLDQELVGGLEPYETLTQVVEVQDHVHDYYRDNCEAEDMEPTSALSACHPIAGQ